MIAWLKNLWARLFGPKLVPYVPPSIEELKSFNVEDETQREVVWMPEPKTGTPQRYDEIERAKKRRRKWWRK